MTANDIVHLLLELNILNADDARRELAHIAARIRNPIGQKWMNRVGWFAINNIDKLVDIPRKAISVHQHQNSPDYPAFNRTQTDPANVEIQPDETDYLHTVEDGETFLELSEQYFDTTDFAKLIARLNPKTVFVSFHPPKRQTVSNEPVGEAVKPDHKDYLNAPIANEQIVRIPTKARLADIGLFTRGTIPKQTREYDITPFTRKMWQQDIEQNFRPVKPDRRKHTSLPYEQPTAKELPPWAAGKEDQMHHFDPIMSSRRELWQDLTSVANYLNFVDTTNPEDFPQVQNDQEMMFRRKRGVLETMPTDDLNGFLDILAKAREWNLEVRTNPWKFTKGDPTIVYKHKNGYVWKRMETIEDLKREGDEMDHCVGNTTYTGRLASGSHEYYSLRDLSDKPHITIEVQHEPAGVLQIKGHSDATSTIPPAEKLMAKEFINSYLRVPVKGNLSSISV